MSPPRDMMPQCITATMAEAESPHRPVPFRHYMYRRKPFTQKHLRHTPWALRDTGAAIASGVVQHSSSLRCGAALVPLGSTARGSTSVRGFEPGLASHPAALDVSACGCLARGRGRARAFGPPAARSGPSPIGMGPDGRRLGTPSPLAAPGGAGPAAASFCGSRTCGDADHRRPGGGVRARTIGSRIIMSRSGLSCTDSDPGRHSYW